MKLPLVSRKSFLTIRLGHIGVALAGSGSGLWLGAPSKNCDCQQSKCYGKDKVMAYIQPDGEVIN